MVITRRSFLAAVPAVALSQPGRPTDPCWLGIGEASGLLRSGKLSPVELIESCRKQAEKYNPRFNAFITMTWERALVQARAAETAIRGSKWRGPLHGIPIGLKDLFDTAGIPTTAASNQFRDRIPAADAEVVRRLSAAGAVIVGKLNMDEFAYNYTSETSALGPIHNPWRIGWSPGGSSGGSAVAVAAGMCLGALGSDTGGSIRLPAALCGITGLKPNYGRVSTEGVLPLSWTLDHAGPMTRTARDAALMLGAMAELPPPPGKTTMLRVGMIRGMFFDEVDPEVATACESVLTTLKGRAAIVADNIAVPKLDLAPGLPGFSAAYLTVISAEASAYHAAMLKASPGKYHPVTRVNLERGLAISATDALLAQREIDGIRRSAGALFAQVDILLTPATHAPAPELGKPAPLTYLRNAAWWNAYGLPAISIPCGFTRSGLPIGIQMVGRPRREDQVLQLAALYQRATDWHSRRPPL